MKVIDAVIIYLFMDVVFGSRVILVENAPTCFRRVLAGKRALRSHVRRVVPCERLEDCRRECALEKRFPCESFNYRIDPSFRGKGLCELMTKPIEAFDIRRDFVEDKDYDFYELDRNSLEPNCPESLRGPGLLHSGFLSSKPSNWAGYQNRWTDRRDWYDQRYNRNYNRYYDDRRGLRNYGSRRYEDQFFVPYQIGLARSEDDQEAWGQYGGYYGGYNDYYKDRNDYHKSVNHWRLNSDLERPYYGVRAGYNSDFNYHSLGKTLGPWESYGYGYGSWKRGRWNSSGGSWNGLEYEESRHHKPVKPVIIYDAVDRSDDTRGKDCSSRRRPGMSLGSGAIRRSILARNVVDCETACFNEREFKCVSYSFRYSSSHSSDNCFLSERPYRGLDLSADSDSDVYGMPQDHGCSVSHRPWVESECFWHVRSGAGVDGNAIRAALTVSGLGACEAECLRARGFFCRGFSFRFDAPTIGDDLENCVLTSSPPTSLEVGSGLRPVTGHELYARGNYGRGCEPALYDDIHHRDKECYLQYDNAAKLTGAAVKGQARVRDEKDCGVACTDAPFRCLSFSFNNNAPPNTDNCLLSEIRLFDLQKGVDYERSVDDWLFAFDLFNGQCWRKVHGRNDYDEPSPELPRPISPTIIEDYPPVSAPVGPDCCESHYNPGSGPPSGPESKPGYLPSGPGYKPGYPPSEPSSPGYVSDHYQPGYPAPRPGYRPGYLPERRPGYKPVYPPEPSGPGYKPGYRPVEPSGPGFKPSYSPPEPSGPGYKPGYIPIEPSRPGYPGRPDSPPGGNRRPGYSDREDGVEEPIMVSWRHYTVSGFPCRRDTSCAQNQVAGHWACEPEGGEIGSWDYCCAPTHRCGYSEGFDKPWCYVGPSQDQWRPCSEKYYPYHQHNVPHPSQGHREDVSRPYPTKPNRPWRRPDYVSDERDKPQGPYLSDEDRRYWDDLYKNGPRAYYDKYGNPLPGYSRVPTEERPQIKYRHNYPDRGSGHWVPVSAFDSQEIDSPVPGGLGVPRYWPVAYLHKGPPPNMTYFRYNETVGTTTERYYPKLPDRDPKPKYEPRPSPPREPALSNRAFPEKSNENNIDVKKPENTNNGDENKRHRDEKTRNITNGDDDILTFNLGKEKPTSTIKSEEKDSKETKEILERKVKNESDSKTDKISSENVKMNQEMEKLKGIDGKIDDFDGSIEVLDIEDAKNGDKLSDLKTLEAEEKQIEAIGQLLASRRGGKLVLEKRSQKDLESKSIALDKDLIDFNFGNRFPTTERKGIVQKVSKDEIAKERNKDRSLEVSETTFVRPPRVLSTTENIRKAIINGKVFYDATIRDQRDIFNSAIRKSKSDVNIREQRDIFSNSTRKGKSSRLEDSRALSVITNSSFGKKKVIRARNVNPVRRVRRVYRKRYNPEEVRKRLLERERSMKENVVSNKKF